MRKIDADAVVPEVGDVTAADHIASAKGNLASAGQLLKNVYTLNHLNDVSRMMNDMARNGGVAGVAIGLALGGLSLPWVAAAEVLDPFLNPAVAAKDVADAAMHGVLAGVRTVLDR